MNNKVLLLVVGLLLLGGVVVLVNNNRNAAQLNQDGTAVPEEVAVDEQVMESEEQMIEEGDEAEPVAVSVNAEGFDPQEVTVAVGSKVVWTNATEATANVSSALHPTHEEYPPLNLGDFEPGETLELTFDEPGTFKYHDHLNPSKFGTVVVE